MPANLQTLNRALALIVPALFCAVPAYAQGPRLDLTPPSWAEITAESSSEPTPSSERTPEISQRLTFLEQRLDAAQLHGQIWYYGWFAANGGGLIMNTVQAATDHSHNNRVSASVEASKSAIGILDLLLRPLPARLGADPIRAMSGSPYERVQAAETLLQASATRAELNRTFWPHFGNAIINLIGGGIILAFGDWQNAALTTGLDFVVGEIEILTEPSRAIGDLAAYRSRYGELPKPTGGSWHLSPSLHGVTVTFRF
ncbi:MAG TPA: hypothetical protein VFL96_11275, partial [Acidobacteriaceae bacterium]|nr:hypothetical protein [Acidobacteriaceae bacterium]